MLYEYQGKIYVRVSNRYYEVNVEKKPDGTFSVIPSKKKEYIENVNSSKVLSISVGEAYKKMKKTEEPLKSRIID